MIAFTVAFEFDDQARGQLSIGDAAVLNPSLSKDHKKAEKQFVKMLRDGLAKIAIDVGKRLEANGNWKLTRRGV